MKFGMFVIEGWWEKAVSINELSPREKTFLGAISLQLIQGSAGVTRRSPGCPVPSWISTSSLLPPIF